MAPKRCGRFLLARRIGAGAGWGADYYVVQVGDVSLRLDSNVAPAFVSGETYRVYYLTTLTTILSAEVLPRQQVLRREQPATHSPGAKR